MRRSRAPLQIPLPGGPGKAPSGPVQFRGDWPGLFIRGDHAVSVAMCIRQLEKQLGSAIKGADVPAWNRLTELASLIEVELVEKPDAQK
ncbi:MAG: hypothetical protein NTW19_08770 [Planctomycetota bacterium]|nr:hypothetical protein [Planctomycetota bacterium]